MTGTKHLKIEHSSTSVVSVMSVCVSCVSCVICRALMVPDDMSRYIQLPKSNAETSYGYLDIWHSNCQCVC